MFRTTLFLTTFLTVLAGPLTGLAATAPLGTDRNGNGLWDDFEQAYSQLNGGAEIAAQNLARHMQDFTLSPEGNQSLALESMRKTQEALLCLYAVTGENGAQVARNLQNALMNHPERARRFMSNQVLIQGEQIPFEQNPKKWGQYCPFPVPN